MLVVRGTKKLRDRVKGVAAGGSDQSTTVLGDWFATALFWKPQAVLLVNQRTLLPVFVPLAPAAKLVERIPAAIAEALRVQGASEEFIAAELAAMGEVRIAPTNDRSILGVMNEFAFVGERRLNRGVYDLAELSADLSSVLLGPLMRGRHGSPDRELAAILAGEPSNVVPLRPKKSPAASNSAQLLQLKVTLLDTSPPVWRRLLVPASTKLDQLHEYIQAAFGWWNYHLYEFQIGRTLYGVPDPDWDWGPRVTPSHGAVLSKVAAVGSSFNYSYDFGDGWEHKVTVEKALPQEPGATVPACIDGRRACPPEDCGGPWGYKELLKILADPSHEDHKERVEWIGEWGGGKLDPEAFDTAEFAVNLDAVRFATFDD